MTPLLIALVVAEGAFLAAAVALLGRPQRPAGIKSSWMRALLATEVVLHTSDGRSIEGLVVLETDKGVMLRGAKLLRDDRGPVDLAGEIWMPRENLSFVQTKPVPVPAAG